MNLRVVIIDDSLTVRMDLAEAFRTAGFDAEPCASLSEGRSAIASSEVALLVLDVVLPDGDGVEFLSELRSEAATENIPIILLSSEAEVKDRLRGLACGANEYVGKPYDAAYLISRATVLMLPRAKPGLSGLQVLVIDDSRTYLEEVGDLLKAAGYRTLLASSGKEGLQLAADLHPDAIIVDGVMEGMDGTTVIRKIRLDPGLHATPCLLLTASEGAASEISALDAGADAYLRKGLGTDLILARVAAIIRASQASRDGSSAASLLGPKRILAVDDSRTYLEVLAEQLRHEGCEVVKAESGQEALELLSVQTVDCILLDLHMPGLSGTETCQRIKQSSELRRIPVIMLTASEDQEAMVAGINAGADDYVSKSVSFDVIKARLRAQLRRKNFEDEHRRIRDDLLRKDAEAEIMRNVAEARQVLLDDISVKNRELAFHLGELGRLNKELEVFAYSVSHDLRQPLRGMDGFSKVLLESYADVLDDQGKHYLKRVRAGAQRMSELIDGLLLLSRVSRSELQLRPLQFDTLAQDVVQRLRDAHPDRIVEACIEEHLDIDGDRALMVSLLENLIGNAWKFTAKREHARIEVGAETRDNERVFHVRDNGAGFDTAYADKLFGPFQRLHSQSEFSGTGIGLATVQRILHRHGGRIWAESKAEEGATFYFTLHEGKNS